MMSPAAKLTLKFFLCFTAGGIASLSMAPANYLIALFAGLSLLYYIIANASSSKTSFLCGWAFGFGYFLFGLSWIGNALLVDGNPYKWAWLLAVSGLPFILSFFTASSCFLSYRFSNLKTATGFLSFSAFTILFEWLRGHVFTGFPWNLYGYAWSDILPVIQIVSIGDIYLLTWLSIIWCSLPGFLIIHSQATKTYISLPMVVIASFIICYGYGTWRLENAESAKHDNFEIRIVQANISQSEKWDNKKMSDHFLKHIDLSRPLEMPEKTTYIIWPETAMSQWFTQDQSSMDLISETLGMYENGAYLITGLLRHNPQTKEYFNSLVMISEDREITNIYDKHHLVPFGEYIPFKNWVPLKTVTSFSGFVKGSGPQTYDTPEGISYLPLICYEIIFPGKAGKAKKTPDFIINITNDAWYGKSAGPWQHLIYAKFRAIEEGITVIRVANTGISALFDPYGRKNHSSNMFETYSKNIKIPKKITTATRTPYLTDIFLMIAIFLLISFGYRLKDVNL